jgi:hypothetical protein
MATPPAGLNLLLLADASGTWFNRWLLLFSY